MAACHDVLLSDSEDNGMVAQRVLFDIHKTYKHALEEQSNPFFTWLLKVSCLMVRKPWGPPCNASAPPHAALFQSASRVRFKVFCL